MATGPFNSSIAFPHLDHTSLPVNPAGTRLAQARPFTAGGTVNLADPTRDYDTLVPHGAQWITIKSALAQGILRRNGSAIEETVPGAGEVW